MDLYIVGLIFGGRRMGVNWGLSSLGCNGVYSYLLWRILYNSLFCCKLLNVISKLFW